MVLALLALAIQLTVSPSHGFEPQRVNVRFKLPQPTEYRICVNFNADGIVWDSCWDGEPDRLFYERKYILDAGNYEIWISTRELGNSERRTITVLERGAPQ